MAYLLPNVPLVPALVDILFHARSLLIGLLLVQTQFLVQSAVRLIITYRCTTPVLIVSCRFSVCTSLLMASRDSNARGTSTFHVFRCGAHGKWPLPPHLQPFWSCSQLRILWRWLGPRLLPPPLFVDRVFLRVLVAIMTMEQALYSTWTESSSGKHNIPSNMFDQIRIASMSPPSAPSDDDVSYTRLPRRKRLGMSQARSSTWTFRLKSQHRRIWILFSLRHPLMSLRHPLSKIESPAHLMAASTHKCSCPRSKMSLITKNQRPLSQRSNFRRVTPRIHLPPLQHLRPCGSMRPIPRLWISSP